MVKLLPKDRWKVIPDTPEANDESETVPTDDTLRQENIDNEGVAISDEVQCTRNESVVDITNSVSKLEVSFWYNFVFLIQSRL